MKVLLINGSPRENGKQSKITDDDLLAVADRFAIGTAPRVLSEVKSAIGRAG